MGMIKKMYGKQALAEEINKLVSEKLYHYIQENKLNILGEPLPNQTEQKAIDFNTQEEFEFCFDVALAPEIKIELSKMIIQILLNFAVGCRTDTNSKQN